MYAWVYYSDMIYGICVLCVCVCVCSIWHIYIYMSV
jgi:hypothetical protein